MKYGSDLIFHSLFYTRRTFCKLLSEMETIFDLFDCNSTGRSHLCCVVAKSTSPPYIHQEIREIREIQFSLIIKQPVHGCGYYYTNKEV